MASLKERNGKYYIQFYRGGKQVRRSLHTDNLQIAKERVRQFESAELRGLDDPLPTRTPIAEVVGPYVDHIRQRKTPKSAQTDIYYLREMFGPICPALEITSRKPSEKARKRPRKKGIDRRLRAITIQAPSFEQITTAHVADFIAAQVRTRGLAPKTANRYREILCRLFNWAMNEGRVKMPGDANPAARVERYKEIAPEIRFLTLPQIAEQLEALRFNPRLQTMVAVLIYAGLRREELLWLQVDDLSRPSPTSPNGLLRIRAKTVAGNRWQPKTARNRAVPISRDLRKHLDAYNVPASDHGWAFPSPEGKRWDPDNFSADLRKANAQHGLKWSCLDYRHTFGSQLAQRGVSLYKISTMMGNSPEICRRHYAALSPESIAVDIEFLPTQHTASITQQPA